MTGRGKVVELGGCGRQERQGRGVNIRPCDQHEPSSFMRRTAWSSAAPLQQQDALPNGKLVRPISNDPRRHKVR